MRWFTRIRRAFAAAKRAITSVPWDKGGPLRTTVSAERAMSLVPVFASVRLLADNIASLPLQGYRRVGDQREPMPSLPALVESPSAVDSTFQWIHKAVVSLALRGNAYGLITQLDGMGHPTMIEWLHPDEVWVDETRPTLPVYYVMGVAVPRDSIVHIRWMVMPGRVQGLSPVSAFASTIGAGLSVVEYGKSWFDHGGHPPATIRNTQKTLNPAEADVVSDRAAARMRMRKPLVFGSDWDFQAVQVNPEESQFIETMRLNATQIAAIYGVPAEKVGGESGGPLTYNTPELNQLDILATLRPWLVRLERAISSLLPERQFVKFNADATIRTSLLDRYRAHDLALRSGWRSRDEIRAIEDLPPIPDGSGSQFVIAGGSGEADGLPAIGEGE